jgi:hypothetical protein
VGSAGRGKPAPTKTFGDDRQRNQPGRNQGLAKTFAWPVLSSVGSWGDQLLARSLICLASFSICWAFFTKEMESVELASVWSTWSFSSATKSYNF